MVKSIPDGHHTVTPYLSLRGAAAAIDFYKRAFGATEIMRIAGPGETIGHAEIKIGDSPIMLADEFAPLEFLSPQSRGGSLKRPVRDEFYGDRTGTIEDPFGHVWHIATHKEDLSPEDLARRAEQAMYKPPNG